MKIEDTKDLKAMLANEVEAKHGAIRTTERVLASVERIEVLATQKVAALDHNQRSLFHRVQQLEETLHADKGSITPKESQQLPKHVRYRVICEIGSRLILPECGDCEWSKVHVLTELPEKPKYPCGATSPVAFMGEGHPKQTAEKIASAETFGRDKEFETSESAD